MNMKNNRERIIDKCSHDTQKEKAIYIHHGLEVFGRIKVNQILRYFSVIYGLDPDRILNRNNMYFLIENHLRCLGTHIGQLACMHSHGRSIS
jgi:hypothetical protein